MAQTPINVRAASGAGANFLATQALAPMGRVNRYPEHTFHLITRPFQIAPFLIAPVLPGETMKNLLMQARVVTDPITNPLIGWWQEYYFFYVKHRDLISVSDKLQEMMLDPTWGAAGNGMVQASAEPRHYYSASAGINWVGLCLERVVEEYFRDEGEAWNIAMVDGLPAAKFMQSGWLDSVLLQSQTGLADDIDVDANADSVIMTSEISEAMNMWMLLRQNNLTQMTYEDWLATYGVRQAEVEINRPELIRYSRSWQYPSSTIDPSTGVPSSAVSWAIRERADKRRFFKEPGFVFGVQITRPKVYMGRLRAAAATMMDHWKPWLPALLTNDREVSLITLTTARGVISGLSQDMSVDMRDLLVHGDQFINFLMASGGPPEVLTAGHNLVPYPAADGQLKYPEALADLHGLFAGTTDAAREVNADGVVKLTIAGRQIDQT